MAQYRLANRETLGGVRPPDVPENRASGVNAFIRLGRSGELPDYQGKGLGRALIDRVRRWAADQGRSAVTLTTFDHIPWNRPLYEHLGFRVITDQQIGPGLRSVRDAEIDPSSITDFTGSVGVADVRGSGVATNPDGTIETLLYDTDMRFMKGLYVGQDGATHRGTFGFV